jgi:hypothetical protein
MHSVIKTALIALAIWSVASPLIHERRNYRFIWSVWKRFRPKMLFEIAGLMIIVLATIAALWRIPGLSWSWVSIFFDGGGHIF